MNSGSTAAPSDPDGRAASANASQFAKIGLATLKATILPVDYVLVIVTIRLTSWRAVPKAPAMEDFLNYRRKWTMLIAIGTRGLAAMTAGLVLSAAATTDVSNTRASQIVSPASEPDPRLLRLEKFFKYYRCVVPYHTSEYLRAADIYGLDYRVLPAVSIRETGCGKGDKQENNLWGFHPGHQSFSSIEVGIDFLAHRLTQHPAYKGKTLRAKLFTYNPLPAYPGEIERIMRQIE
jgi:hypothetical protein